MLNIIKPSLFFCITLLIGADACAKDVPIEKIELPEGFNVQILSDEVDNARSLTLGDHGTIFAGTRVAGRVYALEDWDQDYRIDAVHTIAHGLNFPNGVAFYNGDLYVAEIHRIIRYSSIEAFLEDPPEPEVIYDGFPNELHHGWKYLKFGPDGKLYVSVGSPCNTCVKDNPIFGTIVRMNPDGSDMEIYAKGIRNSVGFDWSPGDQTLWFTDNGRDWLGEDLPPDELNRAPLIDMHFGFPHCHGTNIQDPDFGTKDGCNDYTPPIVELGAHVAALGIEFYDGQQYPDIYHKSIFIAEHGSWNRIEPSGYRITRVAINPDGKLSYRLFAKGWLNIDGTPWGRPVDLLELKDGSLIVSDDFLGVIYRIEYKPKIKVVAK